MKRLLTFALLFTLFCLRSLAADATIANAPGGAITTVPDAYRMPWENPAVQGYYITFQNLSNQVLAGYAGQAYATAAAQAATNGYPWTNVSYIQAQGLTNGWPWTNLTVAHASAVTNGYPWTNVSYIQAQGLTNAAGIIEIVTNGGVLPMKVGNAVLADTATSASTINGLQALTNGHSVSILLSNATANGLFGTNIAYAPIIVSNSSLVVTGSLAYISTALITNKEPAANNVGVGNIIINASAATGTGLSGGHLILSSGAGAGGGGMNGDVYLTTGSPGTSGAATIAITNKPSNMAGGTVGGIRLAAGSATSVAAATTGGPITLTGGSGSPVTAATGTGGNGGTVTILGGPGGLESGTTSATAGNGADVTITSGYGGSATGGSGTRNGGNSGNVVISTGTNGVGATASGTVGTIQLNPGGTNQMTVQTNGVIIAGTATATNGYVQQVKGSFSTNFTCLTNLQFYCLNGTNQIVTLPNAANVPGLIFRFSMTNGYGSFIITNATGAQFVRSTPHLSYTNIGIAEVGFISDSANWWLTSRGKLIMPSASWSLSTTITPIQDTITNIPFDTLEFNNSQGLGLVTDPTFARATRLYVTNAGTYMITFSAVLKGSGNSTGISVWLRANGSDVARTRTDQAFTSAAAQQCMTVNYFSAVGSTTYFELCAASHDASCPTIVGAAANPTGFTAPAMPSIIVTINRVSDPWP